MITLEEAVLTYVAAWNENDETKQRELIEKCWADHGTVTSNYEHIAGREALLESIGTWRRVCPNDRAVLYEWN